jgi:AcrR family transcriptional regulator
MTSDGTRRRGRPRDASIDDRVLDTAELLLTEEGFDATTIQSFAERSGVHASAIYRRWPSRIEIIERAVFPGFAAFAVSPSGDLPKDLRRFIRAYLTTLSRPAARAAVPGLLSSYQSSERSGKPSHGSRCRLVRSSLTS